MAAVRESHVQKPQHAGGHQSEAFLLLLCHRPQGNGSGNVSRSLVILSAGIYQVKSPWLQLLIGFRSGGIMAESRVLPIGRDRSKAQSQISLCLESQLIQMSLDRHLVHIQRTDILLHPAQMTDHGHSVLDVGLSHILHLHRILHCLGGGGRIHLIYNFIALVQTLADSEIDAALLQQDSLVAEGFGKHIDVVVRLYLYAQPLQVSLCLAVQSLIINKEEEFVLCHHCVGKHHRIAGHVVSADIQQPYNVVQRR